MSAPREIKLSSVRRLRHKNRNLRTNSDNLAATPTLRQAVHQHVELVPRNRLIPARRNARTHSKKQIRQIANSILRFGWTYPILIDENGSILAGFGRYKAAELLGLQQVPVIAISGLGEAEKRALALADNKIAANAGWDRPALAAEIGELAVLLPECNLDIDITGFEPAEIDALMGDLVDSEQEPADELPKIAKHAVSARGDLWTLGHHRLGCGDATQESDFRKLMGRERAAMVITDPPYNDPISFVQGRGAIKHREFDGLFTLENASRVKSDLSVLLDQADSVTDEAARGHEFTQRIHSRDRIACRECSDLLNPAVKKKITTDEQCPGSCLDHHAPIRSI